MTTKKIAKWLCHDYIHSLEQQEKSFEQRVQDEVNQRVANIILKIDPMEILMKEYSGIFSQEYERVEEPLGAQGQMQMMMWGYSQAKDPCFNRLHDWVINSQGNETMKRAAATEKRLMYGRAQIASMILYRKEVRRLSSLYEELLAKKNEDGKGVDSGLTVE